MSVLDLLKPPKGLDVDFATPLAAAALVPAGGISWQIFANPVALFIGGVAAVILELAEPSVRCGVWQHSNFRQDPITRLRRTGFAALITVYAPEDAAKKMIARVVAMHNKVEGITENGVAYYANDPRLLTWVHATAMWGFTESYHLYVRTLTIDEKNRAFLEGQKAAALYGADKPPGDWAAWQALLQQTLPSLENHSVLGEFLDIMENAAIFPRPLRFIQRLLVRAAVSSTPLSSNDFPELSGRGLKPYEKILVRALGFMAEHIPLPTLPPAIAKKRMAKKSY